MKLKHHIARNYHAAKQVPLWKWLIVIFIMVAMPLFFSFVNVMQIQQVLWNTDQNQETTAATLIKQ